MKNNVKAKTLIINESCASISNIETAQFHNTEFVRDKMICLESNKEISLGIAKEYTYCNNSHFNKIY